MLNRTKYFTKTSFSVNLKGLQFPDICKYPEHIRYYTSSQQARKNASK
jgi:hypothetical protein